MIRLSDYAHLFPNYQQQGQQLGQIQAQSQLQQGEIWSKLIQALAQTGGQYAQQAEKYAQQEDASSFWKNAQNTQWQAETKPTTVTTDLVGKPLGTPINTSVGMGYYPKPETIPAQRYGGTQDLTQSPEWILKQRVENQNPIVQQMLDRAVQNIQLTANKYTVAPAGSTIIQDNPFALKQEPITTPSKLTGSDIKEWWNPVTKQKVTGTYQPGFQKYETTEAGVYTNAKGEFVAAGTPEAKPYQKTVGKTTQEFKAHFDPSGNIVPATMTPKTATTATGGGKWIAQKDKMENVVGYFNPGTKETILPGDLGLKDFGEGKITSTTKTMIETAPKVKDLANKVSAEIENLSGKLGATSGRWSEMMNTKVGLDDPQYAELRTNIGLLSTLMMRMHMGARGGQMIMEKFDNLLGLGNQSPKNMKSAVQAIIEYANSVESQGVTEKSGNTIKTKQGEYKIEVMP